MIKSRIDEIAEWAQERLDEMDSVLSSLETQAHEMQVEFKTRARHLVADLKKQRDAFYASLKKGKGNDTDAQRVWTDLEAQWAHFLAQVDSYMQIVGSQFEQQQAVYRDMAAAQVKAWKKTVDLLHQTTIKAKAVQAHDLEALSKRVKASALEYEGRLQKLRHAGKETWTALNAALAESRSALDRANEEVREAVRRATK